ncbi:hypothetical protein GHT06_013066 [Daphnia sinensis]|uniref:Chitin-binding type-2 domain-containing protein n=1 Tax=Daphnia sinensis TaxID=1820382 RepID=A0AAD5KWX4_9CRUS|nr:hypothetical protein GHT06_013066 [Daphnia sinensis]
MTIKKFAIFVFVLAAFLVVSTSAMPPVARAAPQCPASDVGTAVFFPDPTNCKNYYMCSWGVAYLKTCPDDLYWNKAINVCDFPSNVIC